MYTYWFLRFTFHHKNPQGNNVEVKGNAVCELKALTFRPGTIMRALEITYRKNNPSKILFDQELQILIDHALQLDKEGFMEFNCTNPLHCVNLSVNYISCETKLGVAGVTIVS